MKYYLTLLAICGALGPAALAAPVSEQRDWTETFDVGDQPTLSVNNIWGDVTITTGPAHRIEMAIESVRRARDRSSFERSLELIPLSIDQIGDEVRFVVGRQNNWRNAPPCHGCRVHVNLIVTVPKNTQLDVSTVNDGDIIVSGVDSRVTVTNVNGSISTGELSQCEQIETVNGDIDVQFVRSPGADCRIETLNGDIELTLANDADVNFAVEVGNGKLRSALDLTPQAVPAAVDHKVRGKRHFYNIEQFAGLQLGRGGHRLTLKSFNGDIALARSQ